MGAEGRQLIPGIDAICSRGQAWMIICVTGKTVGGNFSGVGIPVAIAVQPIDLDDCLGVSAGILIGCTIFVNGVCYVSSAIISVGLVAPLEFT